MIHELGDNVIPVFAIASTFIFGAVWLVLWTVMAMYQTYCDARLKSKLIDRGAGAEEIERVLLATSHKHASGYRQPVPPVKAHGQHSF